MNSKLQVIDNFLDPKDFENLATIISSPKFPWFYIDTVSLPPQDGTLINDPLAVETAGLSHVMYDKEWDVKSFSYKYFETFFKKIETELALNESQMIRARASLKWPKVGFTSDNYNLPHVDYYFPHETLIFYVNDSDGDTFIFNEWFTYTGQGQGIASEKYTIENRISPRANRLVWIDGLHYHTASNPISSNKRIILNINFNKK